MEGLTFKLSGKFACFRKPDVNEYAYFTYHHIHKIALMGLLGSIIGLGGYAQQEDSDYPEFYEKLSNLFMSVVPPRDKRGFFTKKIQTFNNSVGYASHEQGGNLIVREQWLEDPSWDIFIGRTIETDDLLWLRLKEYLLTSKTEYIPYLGKNDHPATLSAVKQVTLRLIQNQKFHKIDSLYEMKQFHIIKKGDLSTDDKKKFGNIEGYLFQDYMPSELASEKNIYKFKKYAYTDHILKNFSADIWECDKSKMIIVSL